MRPLQNKNISQPTSGTMTLHQKKKNKKNKNSQKQNSWFKKQEKKKKWKENMKVWRVNFCQLICFNEKKSFANARFPHSWISHVKMQAD